MWRLRPGSLEASVATGQEWAGAGTRASNVPAVIQPPLQDRGGDFLANGYALGSPSRRDPGQRFSELSVVERGARRDQRRQHVMSSLSGSRLARRAVGSTNIHVIGPIPLLDGVDRVEHGDVQHRVNALRPPEVSATAIPSRHRSCRCSTHQRSRAYSTSSPSRMVGAGRSRPRYWRPCAGRPTHNRDFGRKETLQPQLTSLSSERFPCSRR